MGVRNCGEIGKNLQLIIKRLYKNQNLLKLLYYTDKAPLDNSDLTEEDIKEKINEKLIKVIPRIGPKETSASIVTFTVTNASKNVDNDEYDDIIITVEVFVPLTQWFIKGSNLRPFAIMGEIENSLKNKTINGLGRMVGGDFQLHFLTDEISCYKMVFEITDYD